MANPNVDRIDSTIKYLMEKFLNVKFIFLEINIYSFLL